MSSSPKINIYHIHTDEKFVYGTRLFDFDFLQNHVFFIGDASSYKGVNKAEVSFFSKGKVGLKQLIRECNEADIVVLYELNFLKSYIANRISKSTKILWRFFGTELYARLRQEDIFSKQTLQFLGPAGGHHTSFTRRFLNPAKQWLKWQTTIEAEFKEAVRRIDFFIGLSKDEHQYLKDRFPELPSFLQYPFLEENIDPIVARPSAKRIIIGNNKSAFNNHLDILDILETSANAHNLEYVLLFSYGVENEYTEEVRARAGRIKGVTIIEEFLDRGEFKKLYEEGCGLVINGYRQMAMGNIFIALRKGIKVYLNEYNVMHRWLRHEGFKVYDINMLEEDISNDNCRLSSVDVEHNRKQFVALVKKYNYGHFIEKIRQLAFSD